MLLQNISKCLAISKLHFTS